MFTGIFAAFELWNLGTLNTQIKWLSRLRDKLEGHVHEMQNEVNPVTLFLFCEFVFNTSISQNSNILNI